MDEILIGLGAGLIVSIVAAIAMNWLRVGYVYCGIIGVLGGGVAGGMYARLGWAGDSAVMNGLISGSVGGLALLILVRLFLALLGWKQGQGGDKEEIVGAE